MQEQTLALYTVGTPMLCKALLVRLSLGLEDRQDLIDDLTKALA